jgi:hypothetical protein
MYYYYCYYCFLRARRHRGSCCRWRPRYRKDAGVNDRCEPRRLHSIPASKSCSLLGVTVEWEAHRAPDSAELTIRACQKPLAHSEPTTQASTEPPRPLAPLDVSADPEGVPKVQKKRKATAKGTKGRAVAQKRREVEGQRIQARHRLALPIFHLMKTLFEWQYRG